MGEGGGHFEGYGRMSRVESPQEKFRSELRGEVYHILERSDDPLSIEVANKILEKLQIKDIVDDLVRYKDDPKIYRQWKQLGLFIVIDRTSRIDWVDKKNRFEVKKGDSILDIHLPTVPQDQRNPASMVREVHRSMQLIAEYVTQQDLHPKYLMGVTFEKLARVSRRQGFTVIEPEVPEDIKRGVENVYMRFGDLGVNERSMGKILLCYQSTDKFLQKYSG